jgi:hypothetical protein
LYTLRTGDIILIEAFRLYKTSNTSSFRKKIKHVENINIFILEVRLLIYHEKTGLKGNCQRKD